MKRIALRTIILLSSRLILACTDNSDKLISDLSNPSSFAISGTGSNIITGNSYVFATSLGTINTSTNTIAAVISDPDTPINLITAALISESMYSGNCTSLATMVSSLSGETITSQMSATGCTDRSVISVNLDTSQIYDNDYFQGDDVVTLQVTVDLAPVVSTAATGNTVSDGSGTTEASAGYFALATDNSVVATFSKDLTGGTFAGVLTGAGCVATLGTPAIVSGSSGKTIVWPLTNFAGQAVSSTCTLNIAGVKDLVGNADDPTDTNLNMSITFH